ncbi:hypothetical protein J7E45_16035 [Microbacterium sp. ISL-59]|uniref:hypothetical protein n=1 Tax=Microbacterium sp. ISL-59 TaxID=2819159 RepID=UPI001BEC0735|nr:hypothetical protein [Microbacterium sp. ISL-59]MBT2497122.1 hypothetical protein [Microbacterium sp. ISL-59]
MINDYAHAWDTLTNAIGAAQGKSAGYITEVDHLTVDQRIEVAKVTALLSIAQELSALNSRNNGDDETPNHVHF